MSRQILNVSTPNDGYGDPLRDAFVKTEANFIELYNMNSSGITKGNNYELLWRDSGATYGYNTSSGLTYKNGNLGIDNTTPLYGLDIKKNGTNAIRVLNISGTATGGGGVIIGVDDAAATSIEDRLGFLIYQGTKDGSSTVSNAASIDGYATENWNVSAAGARLEFKTTNNGLTTRSTKMIIDHNGNVGIGLTGFTNKLHIYESKDGAVLQEIQNDNTGTAVMSSIAIGNTPHSSPYDSLFIEHYGTNFTSAGKRYNSGASIHVGTGSSGGLSIGTVNVGTGSTLRFYTANTLRMTIDNSGNTAINRNILDGATVYPFEARSNNGVYPYAALHLSPGGIVQVTNSGITGGSSFQMVTDYAGLKQSWAFKAEAGGPFKLRDNTYGLDVLRIEQSAATYSIYVKAGGNVGIGHSSPTEKLDVMGNVNFNKYQAIAMSCHSGTTLPTTPSLGQWFLYNTTGRKILYQYNGTIWTSIISLSTLIYYVGTTGTDDQDHGYGSGTNAFRTIQYAIDQIPSLNAGNVIINIEDGTYYEVLAIQGKAYTGNYSITIQGPELSGTTVLQSGTMTSWTQGGPSTNYPSPSSFTKTGAGWTTDAYIGYFVQFNDAGFYYPVISNTTDTMVFGDNFLTSLSGSFKLYYPTVTISGATTSTIYDGQLAIYFKNLKIYTTTVRPLLISNFCSVYFTYCWIRLANVNPGMNIGQSFVYLAYCYVQGQSGGSGFAPTTGRMGSTNAVIDCRSGGNAFRLVLGGQLQGNFYMYGNGSTVAINSLACNISVFNFYFNNWTIGIQGADNSNISYQTETFATFVNCTVDIAKQVTTRNSTLVYQTMSRVVKMTSGYNGTGDYDYFNYGTSETAKNIAIDNAGNVSFDENVTISGGTLRYVDGNQATGFILVSDSTGVGSWKMPGSSSTVIAENAGTTITTAQLGTTFTCNSTTSQTFNLPSVDSTELGGELTIVKLGSGTVIILAADSDTIEDSGIGNTIYCSDIGIATITIKLVTTTNWIIKSFTGTWITTD